MGADSLDLVTANTVNAVVKSLHVMPLGLGSTVIYCPQLQ